jgi:endonuclease/exonuclease/phosphatase family metal-dependent hydrolase
MLVALAATNIFNLRAEVGTEEHRFANYNIRYTNDAADTEANGRAWPARSQYVFQLIRDYQFDVMGLEEVSGRSGGTGVVINPATGLSQREEVVKELSEYSFLLFERDGGTKDYSYNALAYRTAKYNLLDNGGFWLSPTPDVASIGWNTSNTIKRTCLWAKLQSKATGDIFFYFVTHCNYGGTIDGENSAHLITSKIDEIAGNYPVILCGDFNMSRVNHPNAYRGYASQLDNTRFIADEFLCVPVANGQTSLTTTEWTPLTKENCSSVSGNEFDYVFSRHMKVSRHNTITENYGRSTNPSDHFAVMAICRLINDDTAQTLCVDANAASGGDGSASAPFRTINEALATARRGDTIRVAEGTYSEQINPTCSTVILGGYDASFTNVIGKSTLSGAGGLSRLVYVPSYYDFSLSNFVVRDAASPSRNDDGAIYCGGNELTLVNVDVVGNTAQNIGAGLYATCRDVTLRGCTFVNNTATATAGGAYINVSNDVTVTDCLFDGNSAKSGSAMQVAGVADFVMMRSTVRGNASTQYGSLYLYPSGAESTFSFVDNTFVNNTLASPSGLATLTKAYGGSAIYAKLTEGMALRMAHNTLTGNSATFAGTNKANFGGSALNVYSGSVILMNNIIAGNYSDNGRGDLYADDNAVMTKEQYNLLTAPASVSITASSTDFLAASVAEGTASLADCLDGSLVDGKFEARAADNGGLTPTVRVVNPTYANAPINVLTANLRFVETSFGVDLNGDGRLLGGWSTDQRGAERNASSVPGACEVIADDALTGVSADAVCLLAQGGNRFRFSAPIGKATLYNTSGIAVGTASLLDEDAELNLTGLTPGVYFVRGTLVGEVFKLIVR